MDEVLAEYLKYSGDSMISFITGFFKTCYLITSTVLFSGDVQQKETSIDRSSREQLRYSVSLARPSLHTEGESVQAGGRKNKLHDKHGGSRKGFSTIDHVFTLASIIQRGFKLQSGRLLLTTHGSSTRWVDKCCGL